jgi:5-methylcytosine-specific restriction endonuclease McrA
VTSTPRPPWRTGHRWRRTRQRVIRRDTTCYLCGHPLNPTHQHPHPQSTVVDHIQPASHNPDAALDVTNLAATHKVCNERKGNRAADDYIADQPSRDW